MSLPQRIAATVTSNARVVLVVMVLATALVGSGATLLEDDASLSGLESDSPEAEARDYAEENFTVEENATEAMLVRTGENVLTRDSLIESLELQREIRSNESINETLVDDEPVTGVENVLAMAAIREERVDELEQRADELEARQDELNETEDRLEEGLNETRDLQRAFEEDVAERGLEEGDPEYQERREQLEEEVDAVIEEVTEDRTDNQRTSYEQYVESVRVIESRLVELEREHGENVTEQSEYVRITEQEVDTVYDQALSLALQADFVELMSELGDLEDEEERIREMDRPPLEEQIAALERLDDEEFEELIADTFDGDDPRTNDALRLLGSSYEPGSTEADARLTVVTQEVEDAGGVQMGVEEERIIESQLALRELASEHGEVDDDESAYRVFGGGLLEDEVSRSMTDSLWIVGPLTLLFVVGALAIAYRDPLDILLGMAGIVAVLIWTFGLLGWSGFSFNVLFVAVPILLIGLSIDFALHVFMRYREHRESRRGSDTRTGETAADSVRGSMAIALAGVGAALVWVTATTSFGFLANAVSPLGMIREFGVVSAFGIGSALLIFGLLVPAAKVELDSRLEARGFDRRRRAFGTGGGRFSRALSIGAVAARKAPLAVLFATLVLTAGGVYGATQVDTTFEEEDFIAEDPSEWTRNLPGPMAPGEYQAKDDLNVLNEHFHGGDEARILVRGNVTRDDTVRRLASAEDAAAGSDAVYVLPNGDADVRSPLSVMERVAEEDDSFNESFRNADTDGDGVPDEDLEGLYDDLFAADEDAAAEVIHRTDVEAESDSATDAAGETEYAAVLVHVAIRGDASYAETADEMRAIATALEDDGADGNDGSDANGSQVDEEALDGTDGTEEGEANATDGGSDGSTDAWSAIATGDSVVNHTIEVDLRDTVVEGMVVAFVAALAFLMVAYRLTGKGATLGAVTLLPVTLAVSWILGTMYLLGIPFNVLTVMISSLTIGLGVDYSIHVSSRYRLELERQGNAWAAMHTTVTGTGGALLGSAATTVAAFGTLAFAILPVLRQFGIVTGLTIVYSFLASVVVLPTLLVLWTRYLGPEDASFESPEASPVAASGGAAGEERETSGDE